eukprot:2474-Heterococcus_DN1.PRE.1
MLCTTELSSQSGLAALLQVASANKLQQLALGAVTLRSNGYVQLLEALRCHDTKLQQLTIEAPFECVTLGSATVEQKRAVPGDVLSIAVNHYLSDYFVRTRGRLQSISLARCSIGARTFMYRALCKLQSHLTSLDLSGNTVSDDGAAALLQALAVQHKQCKVAITSKNMTPDKRNSSSSGGLLTLDIGHNLITSTGGKAIAALLNATALQ